MAAQTTGTNSTTTDTGTATSTSWYDQTFNCTNGMMLGDQGFGGGPGFGRGHGRGDIGFMGGMDNIEISSEYNATINSILSNDTDVQNLIAQGFNVTSIRPIVKNVLAADGTVTTKATTAIVTMLNGTSGRASVNVDISSSKVTQIVIVTRTVIDKTTS